MCVSVCARARVNGVDGRCHTCLLHGPYMGWLHCAVRFGRRLHMPVLPAQQHNMAVQCCCFFAGLGEFGTAALCLCPAERCLLALNMLCLV